MKYLIKTYCLERHYLGYIVEADSEEEARELLETGEGDLEYDDYDCTDHSEIIDIKEYES